VGESFAKDSRIGDLDLERVESPVQPPADPAAGLEAFASQ
jgi:hypothetical protein